MQRRPGTRIKQFATLIFINNRQDRGSCGPPTAASLVSLASRLSYVSPRDPRAVVDLQVGRFASMAHLCCSRAKLSGRRPRTTLTDAVCIPNFHLCIWHEMILAPRPPNNTARAIFSSGGLLHGNVLFSRMQTWFFLPGEFNLMVYCFVL